MWFCRFNKPHYHVSYRIGLINRICQVSYRIFWGIVKIRAYFKLYIYSDPKYQISFDVKMRAKARITQLNHIRLKIFITKIKWCMPTYFSQCLLYFDICKTLAL